MTKKSNVVKIESDFGKIKPCGNPHGGCSYNHTSLRSEQQATIYSNRVRCEE